MRNIEVVELELEQAKKELRVADESDLLKIEIAKSKVERLEKELELIKRGPRKATVVNGLPKGKYKVNNNKRRKIVGNRIDI